MLTCCPTPAPTLEQIGPAYNLELDSVASGTLLQVRVSLSADLGVERNLGADVEPFALDPVICRRELTQL
jgi:hypothetical protein